MSQPREPPRPQTSAQPAQRAGAADDDLSDYPAAQTSSATHPSLAQRPPLRHHVPASRLSRAGAAVGVDGVAAGYGSEHDVSTDRHSCRRRGESRYERERASAASLLLREAQHAQHARTPSQTGSVAGSHASSHAGHSSHAAGRLSHAGAGRASHAGMQGHVSSHAGMARAAPSSAGWHGARHGDWNSPLGVADSKGPLLRPLERSISQLGASAQHLRDGCAASEDDQSMPSSAETLPALMHSNAAVDHDQRNTTGVMRPRMHARAALAAGGGTMSKAKTYHGSLADAAHAHQSQLRRGPRVTLTLVRVWPNGDSGLLQVDKAQLISSYGVQARDLHLLESQMMRQAYCILNRDKCILVNMAYVRCIITAQYVLLLPPDDDRSALFLANLKARISPQAQVAQALLDGELLPPPRGLDYGLHLHHHHHHHGHIHWHWHGHGHDHAHGQEGPKQGHMQGHVQQGLGQGSGHELTSESQRPPMLSRRSKSYSGALTSWQSAPSRQQLQHHQQQPSQQQQQQQQWLPQSGMGGWASPPQHTSHLQQQQQQHHQHPSAWHRPESLGMDNASMDNHRRHVSFLQPANSPRHSDTGQLHHHHHHHAHQDGHLRWGASLNPGPASGRRFRSSGRKHHEPPWPTTGINLSGMDLPGHERVQEELPFELHVLEVCLDELAQDSLQRAYELDRSLRPATERLRNLVLPENLDSVRKLKGRLTALKAMVQGVCLALEERLEDDSDMRGMRLTALHQQEVLLLKRVSKFPIMEGQDEEECCDSDSSSDDGAMEVSQVERLLDWYFRQFDNLYDQLQDLAELVSGSEAVVNIRLDAHRNKLLSVDVMAQGFAMINCFAIGIFGWFTMNLRPNPDIAAHWGPDGDTNTFTSVVIPSIGGAYLAFLTGLFLLFRYNILNIS